MEIKLFRFIRDIDDKVWNSLITHNYPLKCADHLKAVENSNIACGQYWYLLFYQEGKLVGNTSLFTIEIYIDQAAADKKGFFSKIRKIYPNFMKIKVLCCGTPIATCTNTLMIDEEYKEEVLSHLNDAMWDIGKIEKAHVLMMRDFSTKESESMDSLLAPLYHKAHSLPTTLLSIKWPTFEDFVSSFKSSEKAKIKRNIKKFNNGSFTVRIDSDFAKYGKDMERLYLNVLSKSKDKFETLTADYFKNASDMPGEMSKAILVFDKDILIAFELVLCEGQKITPLYVGIDYSYNDEFMIYFNMLYQIVKFGIENHCEMIEIGQTCYYPKMKIGAVIEDMYMYIRFRNILLDKIVAMLLPSMFPHVTPESIGKERKE